MPAFLLAGDAASRLWASKAFEDSHTVIEGILIQRITGYTSEWLLGKGGQEYQERYCTAKKVRCIPLDIVTRPALN